MKLFSLLICISFVKCCLAEDLYKILGVNKDATPENIKKAYKKLALSYHPDKNKGDKEAEKKFIEVNKAYDVLKDPKRREQYDMGVVDNDSYFDSSHRSYGDYYQGKTGAFDDFQFGFDFEPHFGRNHRNMDFKDFFSEFDDLTNFKHFFNHEKKHGKDKTFSNDKTQRRQSESRRNTHRGNRFDFMPDDSIFFDNVPHEYTASSYFQEFKGNDNKGGSSRNRHHKVCRTVTTNVNGVVTTYTECS